MTNNGWGSKWPVTVEDWFTHSSDATPEAAGIIWDGGIKHKIISQTELKSQGSNLIDDQAYLYFQCEGCEDIFDPHTKSFKTLEDKRHAAGWKVKWNLSGMGYKVYCTKCGEKV